MAAGVTTLYTPGSPNGGAKQLLASRGKGVKRSVIIHVYNAATVTAFISHEKNLLQEPLTQNDTNFGVQAGIPIGKNGAVTPFIIQDWEGAMWGTGSADGTQIMFEETFG